MSMDRSTLRKHGLSLACWLCPLMVLAQEPIPAPQPILPPRRAPGELMAPRPVEPVPAPRPAAPTPAPPNQAAPPAPLNPAILGNGLPAKPPAKIDPEEVQRLLARLKAERNALSTERAAAAQALADDDGTEERMAQLRLKLAEYLGKLGARRFPERVRAATEAAGPFPRSARPPGQAAPRTDKAPASLSRPAVDPVALGRTLFRSRDFESALRAFRQVNLTGMKPEERRPIEYLIATCLKHLGKLDEAATIYREVAGSKGDEILADCAQWQLSTLKWQRDLDRQIQDLSQHLQTLENKR